MRDRHPDDPEEQDLRACAAEDAHAMTMLMWISTEGGRKCPQCGRYASRGDLKDLSYSARHDDGRHTHVSMFGHAAGRGCNTRSKP